MQTPRTRSDTFVLFARELTGNQVKNPQGEDLGNIEELAIDVASGRIAYAVLSFGGFLGLGDKLFAIPWEGLRLQTKEGTFASEKIFILNVDKETLKNAPGFEKNNWPDMSDRHWGNDIYNYYGYRPYW